MKRFSAWLIACAFATVPMSVSAQTVIDFDAVGFDINAIPHVTFTGAQVVTHGGITGLSGTKGFGWTAFSTPIEATFASNLIVSSVSILAARDGGPGLRLEGFDIDGNSLGQVEWIAPVVGTTVDGYQVLGLTVADANTSIARVTITGLASDTPGNVILDDFTFRAAAVPGPDPVPEPLTMALAAAALGAAWRKRRRS